MKISKLILLFILTFNTYAVDVETMIENASDNEENIIINPITGKIYNIYTTYDIARDLMQLKASGKLDISINDALEAMKSANPNHMNKLQDQDFIRSLAYHGMNMDLNTRDEIISYAKIYMEKTENNYYLKHLKIGEDLNNLHSIPIEDLKNHIISFSDYIKLELPLEVLEARVSEVNLEDLSKITSHLLDHYLNSKIDSSILKSFIEKTGINISMIACEQIRQAREWLDEDEYPGTLAMINNHDSENQEERDDLYFIKENYQTNIQNAAKTLKKYNIIGLSNETKCSENETLFSLFANEEYFDANDLNREIKKLTPSEETALVNSPCVIYNNFELFQSCDIAKIVWHLEKIEKLKVKNEQYYITGENIGNCEAFFETTLKQNQKITLLKVIHNSGSEALLESSPTTLINYLLK